MAISASNDSPGSALQLGQQPQPAHGRVVYRLVDDKHLKPRDRKLREPGHDLNADLVGEPVDKACSSARVTSREPSAARICARWYGIARPDQSYRAI